MDTISDISAPTTQECQTQIVATELLREKIRTYSSQQREKKRANTHDSVRFGLGEILAKIEAIENLTEKDVSGLAARIKRRKHASAEDMYRLSHAFLQGIENIRIFAKITGAIQVLVKELTGNDAVRQLCALECLCNLSLGEAPVCEKIANLAGCYLVMYLDSLEERLQRTSLWTLQNVLATEGKGAHTLMQLELLPVLWRLYTADNIKIHETEDDFREDAGKCLQLIAFRSNELLCQKDYNFIFKNFTAKNPTCPAAEYHLLILCHCEVVKEEQELNESQLLYLINFSLSNLACSSDISISSTHLRLFYAVRTLGNLIAGNKQALNLLVQQLSMARQSNLASMCNQLFAFRNKALTQETLWLVKNILQTADKLSILLAENFLAQLRVYHEDELVANGSENDLELG